MLIASYKSGRETWWVGNSVSDIHSRADEVEEIQADGDELAHIVNRFSNLPMSKGPVVRWVGDLAKFIAANL